MCVINISFPGADVDHTPDHSDGFSKYIVIPGLGEHCSCVSTSLPDDNVDTQEECLIKPGIV
jgi:hypothetical protein